jgi:hypothetical protein
MFLLFFFLLMPRNIQQLKLFNLMFAFFSARINRFIGQIIRSSHVRSGNFQEGTGWWLHLHFILGLIQLIMAFKIILGMFAGYILFSFDFIFFDDLLKNLALRFCFLRHDVLKSGHVVPNQKHV